METFGLAHTMEETALNATCAEYREKNSLELMTSVITTSAIPVEDGVILPESAARKVRATAASVAKASWAARQPAASREEARQKTEAKGDLAKDSKPSRDCNQRSWPQAVWEQRVTDGAWH